MARSWDCPSQEECCLHAIADGEARNTFALHDYRFSYKAEDRMVIKHLISFSEDDPGAFAWTSNIS